MEEEGAAKQSGDTAAIAEEEAVEIAIGMGLARIAHTTPFHERFGRQVWLQHDICIQLDVIIGEVEDGLATAEGV